MPALPMAVMTWDFTRLWRTFRTAPLTWTPATLYAQDSDIDGNLFNGFSAGRMTSAGNIGGVGGGFPLYFLGDGLPELPQKITSPDILDEEWIGNLSFYDASRGCWYITVSGTPYWYLLVTDYNVATHLTMLRGTIGAGGAISWAVMDQANQPENPEDQSQIRWNGGTLVDVFCSQPGGGYGFQTFDATANTWSAPFGVDSFDPGTVGRTLTLGNANSVHGSGIYRYPNDDLGVVYTARVNSDLSIEHENKLWYREYASGSWGSEVVVAANSDFGVIQSTASGSGFNDGGFVAGNTYDIQGYSGSGGFYFWNYQGLGGTVLVNTVDGSGRITSYTLLTGGGGYNSGQAIIVPTGYGFPTSAGLALLQGLAITVTVDASSQYTFHGAIAPDPSQESLHLVMTYGNGTRMFGEQTGMYHIIAHGGSVSPLLFQFPTRSAGTDQFGNPVVVHDGGGVYRILVSFDDYDTDQNNIWEGVITGGATTFYEAALPVPAIEAGGTPSCAFMCIGDYAPNRGALLPRYVPGEIPAY